MYKHANLLKKCHRSFGSNYFILFLCHHYSNETFKDLGNNAESVFFSFSFPVSCYFELLFYDLVTPGYSHKLWFHQIKIQWCLTMQ